MAHKKENEHKINGEIRSEKVRLVTENSEPQIVDLKTALELAVSQELDLVEVSSGQDISVVKIMDYSKFRFEQLKKAKDAKKKQKVIHIKEVKLRPGIDSHDFDFKVKHAREFLQDGDKVKFTMMFRGREIMHQELATTKMNDVIETLKDVAEVEKRPSVEGRNMTMILGPNAQAQKK